MLGEPVLVRDYRKGEEKWAQGVVLEKPGPVLYKVNVGAGVWNHHVDQALTRPDPEPQQAAVNPPVSPPVLLPQSDSDTTFHPSTPHHKENDDRVPDITEPSETHQSTDPPPTGHTEVTETVRITKPPIHYHDE